MAYMTERLWRARCVPAKRRPRLVELSLLFLGFHTLQNNRSIVSEGPRIPRKSRVDSSEADSAIGAFSGLLTPLSAPHKDALHPRAVILSADEPADPQEILRAFERSLTGDLPNSAHDSQDPRGRQKARSLLRSWWAPPGPRVHPNRRR